jgi:hypothetical protein
MFDIASPDSTESPEFKYLEHAGWKANRGSIAIGVLPAVTRPFRPDPNRSVKLSLKSIILACSTNSFEWC